MMGSDNGGAQNDGEVSQDRDYSSRSGPPGTAKARPRSRNWPRRSLAWLGLTFTSLVLVAAGGLWVLDRLYPMDLSRYQSHSTVVLDNQGRILRAFLSGDDKWRLRTRPRDVDPRFLRMLTHVEDKRFHSHFGVDPLAMARAGVQFLANGRVVSGASTLTMQAARLLHPETLGSDTRSPLIKLSQVLRAIQLEYHLSKEEILRIYLTLAPYGGNLEGLRAASLAWFGKDPIALNAGEAALLVALPQSPERQRPDRQGEAARAARDLVLHKVFEGGLIDGAGLAEALSEPMPDRRQSFPFLAPRFARYLARREASLDGRGRIIRTHVDGALQTTLEEVAGRHALYLETGATLAVVVADNRSRGIIAYLGGHDFHGPQGQVDLARAVRSPGSALKPFIYAMAFDDHLLHPETLIEDRRVAFGHYAPRNFDRSFQGTVSARMALQQSLNVPAVAVLDRLGPVRLYAGLEQAGADLRLPVGASRASLPLALGGVGITLTDLTGLYAGIANGGRMEPLAFSANGTDKDGQVARRLFGQEAAWYVRDILEDVPLPDGWGAARNIVRDRSIAFKTGTSAAFQDAWAVGFSRRYTVGVWMGRADGGSRPGRIGRNEAAPFMLRVFGLLPAEPAAIDPPPENILNAASADALPAGLKRFEIKDRFTGLDRADDPRITYPPNGSTIIYPRSGEPVLLTAEGGRGRLRWIVNGRVLPENTETVQGASSMAPWMADGEGFVDVSVVDETGRSARSVFRVVR